MERNTFKEKFESVIDWAVDDIVEMAEECRGKQSITSDIDIMYMQDDMKMYLRQINMIQTASTVMQLRKALERVFNKKAVKSYMKIL